MRCCSGAVADVQPVAPRRGRVSLYPALKVKVAQDLASFDRVYPSGADYVVMPAMRDDNNPAITAWLKQQADRGARIIGGLRRGASCGPRRAPQWAALHDSLVIPQHLA